MSSVRHGHCVRHGRKGKHVRFCRVDRGFLRFYCFAMFACFVFSLTKLVIGFLYVNTCPAQAMVPIYPIVGGIIPLFLFLTCRLVESKKSGDYEIICYDRREGVVVFVVGLVFTCWLSVGTYFITVAVQDVDTCKTTDFNTSGYSTENTTSTYYVNGTTVPPPVVSSNTTSTYVNVTTVPPPVVYSNTTIIPHSTTHGSVNRTIESTNTTIMSTNTKRCTACSAFLLKFSYSVMIIDWCALVICCLSYPVFYLLMMLSMVLYYYWFEDEQ